MHLLKILKVILLFGAMLKGTRVGKENKIRKDFNRK